MKLHSLVLFVFKSTNVFYNFKIHLFSFWNTKQTNDGIFSNITGENFNLAKNFWNVRVRLKCYIIFQTREIYSQIKGGKLTIRPLNWCYWVLNPEINWFYKISSFKRGNSPKGKLSCLFYYCICEIIDWDINIYRKNSNKSSLYK